MIEQLTQHKEVILYLSASYMFISIGIYYSAPKIISILMQLRALIKRR